MSGPGNAPEWSPDFKVPDGWRPNDNPESWPRSAVDSITLPGGGKVPTYYCLFCEAPAAVEGRPTTPELIQKYGEEATIHVCFTCGYVREVAYPADAKSDA